MPKFLGVNGCTRNRQDIGNEYFYGDGIACLTDSWQPADRQSLLHNQQDRDLKSEFQPHVLGEFYPYGRTGLYPRLRSKNLILLIIVKGGSCKTQHQSGINRWIKGKNE